MTANVCRPELLTVIEVQQAGAYVVNPLYAMQPKRDGKRLIVSARSGRVEVFNKLGERCDAPAWLTSSMPDVSVDGELEAARRRFVAFDLLDCAGQDLRPLAYSQRLAALDTIVQRGFLPECCQLIPTWRSAEEKERELFRAVAARWEGVVFKKLDAPYKPGRAGQHVKLKFVKMCTVRVSQVEPTSARIEMLDNGNGWQEVSGVSLIGRPRVRPGDFIEVKYLYATRERNGHPKLNQPVMLAVRDDVADLDCSTEQLVFKNLEVE
jgi:bifunctional non-homologous end joining protein LigD